MNKVWEQLIQGGGQSSQNVQNKLKLKVRESALSIYYSIWFLGGQSQHCLTNIVTQVPTGVVYYEALKTIHKKILGNIKFLPILTVGVSNLDPIITKIKYA